MPIALHTPPAVELALRIQWRRAGTISLASGGRLVFPPVKEEPGVYRIRCSRPGGEVRVYVGQSSNVRQRVRTYSRPSKNTRHTTKTPNRLLHNDLVAVLRNGGSAQFSVAKPPTLWIGNGEVSLDMRALSHRVLIEHAALVYADIRGRATIINADTWVQTAAVDTAPLP